MSNITGYHIQLKLVVSKVSYYVKWETCENLRVFPEINLKAYNYFYKFLESILMRPPPTPCLPPQEFGNKENSHWSLNITVRNQKITSPVMRNHCRGARLYLGFPWLGHCPFFPVAQPKDLAVITSPLFYFYFPSNLSTNHDSPTVEICHHLYCLHSFPRNGFLSLRSWQQPLHWSSWRCPSVSSVRCQHSNHGDTATMCIRSSGPLPEPPPVSHVTQRRCWCPQDDLNDPVGSRALHTLLTPRYQLPSATSATHPLAQSALATLTLLLFVELRRPGPASETEPLPFPFAWSTLHQLDSCHAPSLSSDLDSNALFLGWASLITLF